MLEDPREPAGPCAPKYWKLKWPITSKLTLNLDLARKHLECFESAFLQNFPTFRFATSYGSIKQHRLLSDFIALEHLSTASCEEIWITTRAPLVLMKAHHRQLRETNRWSWRQLAHKLQHVWMNCAFSHQDVERVNEADSSEMSDLITRWPCTNWWVMVQGIAATATAAIQLVYHWRSIRRAKLKRVFFYSTLDRTANIVKPVICLLFRSWSAWNGSCWVSTHL